MAACCEVLAFGLGALTSMPAVRNFSICAAIAVGLDFLLQVSKWYIPSGKRCGGLGDSGFLWMGWVGNWFR
jgi:hypothetical protein